MPEKTFEDTVDATKTAALALRDASARLTEHIGKEADSAAKDVRRSLMKVSERASKDMDKLIRDLEEAYLGPLPPEPESTSGIGNAAFHPESLARHVEGSPSALCA